MILLWAAVYEIRVYNNTLTIIIPKLSLECNIKYNCDSNVNDINIIIKHNNRIL